MIAEMQRSNLAGIRRLRKAVKKLIKAEVADSWKGGGYVEDSPTIKAELVMAKAEFEKALDALRIGH